MTVGALALWFLWFTGSIVTMGVIATGTSWLDGYDNRTAHGGQCLVMTVLSLCAWPILLIAAGASWIRDSRLKIARDAKETAEEARRLAQLEERRITAEVKQLEREMGI